MAGALAAASVYSATPAVAAQLSDQYVSDSEDGTATATYTISSDGRAKDGFSAVLESWLLSGDASAYEVRADSYSGSLTSGTEATWLSCSSDRSWSKVNSFHNNSVLTAGITVQIRNASTLAVLATATVTLSAESYTSSGGGHGPDF